MALCPLVVELEPVAGCREPHKVDSYRRRRASSPPPATASVTRDPAGTHHRASALVKTGPPQNDQSEILRSPTWRAGRSRLKSRPSRMTRLTTVPASVRLMVERAVAFRDGSGLGDIAIGSLKLSTSHPPTTPTESRLRLPALAAPMPTDLGIFAARP